MLEPAQILFVEDDETIALGLVHALRRDGHSVHHFPSGEAALEWVAEQGLPDLAILDVMLPGIDGLEILRQLKERDPKLPVMLVTARQSETDRVEGLDGGADDYITKPFSLKVLLAKVRAWLRRTRGTGGTMRIGEVEVDLRKRVLRQGPDEVRLTTHEAAVLGYLIEHAGRDVPREELLEKVWGYAPTMQTRTVDNQILKLRKKIEASPSSPRHILTIHGVGYRFER
jgi:two-component system alkaline phosphatase synthesis response regulator PhoP